MGKSLGDCDEEQIADEHHVGSEYNLVEVGTRVTQVHKHQNDIGRLDQRQNHKAPLDHAPSEGFRSFEVNPHDDLNRSEQSQDGGHLPNIFANGGTLLFAVMRIQRVAIVHYEIVAFHVLRIRRLCVGRIR